MLRCATVLTRTFVYCDVVMFASMAFMLRPGQATVQYQDRIGPMLWLGVHDDEFGISLVSIPIATKFTFAGAPHEVRRVSYGVFDVLGVTLPGGWTGTVRLTDVQEPPPWGEN